MSAAWRGRIVGAIVGAAGALAILEGARLSTVLVLVGAFFATGLGWALLKARS